MNATLWKIEIQVEVNCTPCNHSNLFFNFCWPLTINSICSFWQLHSIWGAGGGGVGISGTAGNMTMKFLPDVQKRSICNFWNATFGHASFTKFCRIINIDVRNYTWKFQIDSSKIGFFTEQSAKWRQMLVSKIQNGL